MFVGRMVSFCHWGDSTSDTRQKMRGLLQRYGDGSGQTGVVICQNIFDQRKGFKLFQQKMQI